MKEIKKDSRVVRIVTYVGVVLMLAAAIWYLYKASRLLF